MQPPPSSSEGSPAGRDAGGAGPVPLRPDYDDDPGRWASHDRSTYLAADIHELVAAQVVARALHRVLDVGCGQGRLREVLPAAWAWTGIDTSPTQLRLAPKAARVARADACELPFAAASFDAVAALWSLYHLEAPTRAIAEARRALRPGGVFFACTSSRRNDPEPTEAYPATTFDAEEAPELVASVFGAGSVEAMHWDAPLVHLPDEAALRRYLRSHHLPAETSARVRTPLTLTKRGCLVTAHVPG